MPTSYHIGCAGWAIPASAGERFPVPGTHLQRYADRFAAVEINSSFHRPHRPTTYARWAESVPPGFRFSVKAPREITHRLRLREAEEVLDGFLSQVSALGNRLGCLLIQLPPGLALEEEVARGFLSALRARYPGPAALEPRHPSWFSDSANGLLIDHRIARVAADPAPLPAGELPAGCRSISYFRLHGSPEVYRSSYDRAYLEMLLQHIREAARVSDRVWCIFDNTARGAAVGNALTLLDLLDG